MQVAELSWIPSYAAVLELEVSETPSADGVTPRSTIPAMVSATEIAPNIPSLGDCNPWLGSPQRCWTSHSDCTIDPCERSSGWASTSSYRFEPCLGGSIIGNA